MQSKSILTVACCALGLAALARPATAQPSAEKIKEHDARLRFAPMWMPVPRFVADPHAKNALLPPCACYAIVWETEWQKELGISADQKQKLLAIHAKALADAEQHSEKFKALSPEQKKAEVKSWEGESSPWRKQFDREICQQLEAVLEPRQLQTIKDYMFPVSAIGAMYDAKLRQEIGLTLKQEEDFRLLAKQHLARFQEISLERAEKVWALMAPQQQTALADVVKHQGPTSAILSLAYELGFNPDAMGLSYPMLAESPVRGRLKLNGEQEKQLQAVMADVAAEVKARLDAPQLESKADDKKRIEAILTPQQLATLNEINFRRQVVLAVGYPEKRKTIGMTDAQAADVERLDKESHDRLYPIDREMLAKAVKILTPAQRDQLAKVIDQRAGG